MSNQELIASTKQSLASLNARREALESEASAITSELHAPTGEGGKGPPMGIDTPLVDRDGYPRSDIDIYRARTLRGRLAQIRTDHEGLMKDIERHLQHLAILNNPKRVQEEKAELAARQQTKPKPKYDAATGKWVVKNWDGTISGTSTGESRSFDTLQTSASSQQVEVSSNGGGGATASPPRTLVAGEFSKPTMAFAKVNAVAPHSPAETAGLKEDDLILRFGKITLDSPQGFQGLAEVVPEAAGEGKPIEILVKRGQNVHTVNLVPRPWAGRGLIGCHIVPYQTS